MELITSCKQTRRIVDEADRPDALPYSAAGHIASCGECRTFAEERERLRHLLTSPARVSAPANFDAVLRQRLQERAAQKVNPLRRAFSWFSPAGYVRLGAATAGLLIFFMTAQVMLRDEPQTPTRPGSVQRREQLAVTPPAPTPTPPPPALVTPGIERGEIQPPRVSHPGMYQNRRELVRPVSHTVSPERGGAVPPDVVIVRGPNGEIEVPVRPVSVGAQPILYVSGGQQSAPPVRTTF
ncbi:MAG TPA: hypothetical protein VNO70_24790 [Blastocatellia bacterium]|nr:hypothetical protein [Blastocatellia bacterium]